MARVMVSVRVRVSKVAWATGVSKAPSAMAWRWEKHEPWSLSSSGESLICQKHKGGWNPRVECQEAACVARVCSWGRK